MRANPVIMVWYRELKKTIYYFSIPSISFPEPSLPLSSGTGKRSTLGKSVFDDKQAISFPELSSHRYPCPAERENEVLWENPGAFHSTKNSGLNFRNFVCRMEQCFPPDHARPISFCSRLSTFPTKDYSRKC